MEQLQSHLWLTASSYMYMVKYLRISSYIWKPFLIYDFAILNFPTYEANFIFFFISVELHLQKKPRTDMNTWSPEVTLRGRLESRGQTGGPGNGASIHRSLFATPPPPPPEILKTNAS